MVKQWVIFQERTTPPLLNDNSKMYQDIQGGEVGQLASRFLHWIDVDFPRMTFFVCIIR